MEYTFINIYYTLLGFPSKLRLSFHSLIYVGLYMYVYVGGPGSSGGIATDYGMGDPGLNRSGDEIFRPSRRALRPTQSP